MADEIKSGQLTATPSSAPTWVWALLTVIVPIVVTAATQMSGLFQKGRELDIKLVELGVNILRAGPQETGSKAARGWAIDVIEKYSGVSFTKEAKQALMNNALPIVINIPQISSQTDSSSGGWVAVGFLGSGNADDLNFSLANGQPIPNPLTTGTILKAKTGVNVRPGPANWNSVTFVLNQGQCFTVTESRALKAGDRDQTWARGDVSTCSAH